MQASVHPLLAPLEGWLLDHPVLGGIAVAAVVGLVGEGLHRLVRAYVLGQVARLSRAISSRWDDAFLQSRLPGRVAWAVPLFVWYHGLALVPGLPAGVAELLRRILLAGFVVVFVRSFSAFLDGVHTIYQGLPRGKERPIKGYLQVANVLAYMVGIVLVVAALADRSPWIFLSGMGAMTAVLLLVFRDTLLSLVAGIQITANDLLRVGDWIEMPQFSADGDVVDVALNYVKVQNWDRTFTVIPAHKFLENSFRNWRGMQESGGRRIKRSVLIDQTTVRFLAEDEVAAFGEWELLRAYVERKRKEIEEYNRARGGEGVRVPNHRRLTNLGTFRAYLIAYLKQHPEIHQGMTLLVRQLAPGPDGLPMEVYVFTSDVRWGEYERVQGDIFDHILASVPRFGLRVFQSPSGWDLRQGFGRDAAATGAVAPPGPGA